MSLLNLKAFGFYAVRIAARNAKKGARGEARLTDTYQMVGMITSPLWSQMLQC